jgi:AAA+ ATPase superfamily predicted ATPase
MIGRQREAAILERAANSTRSEFVAVYGRRRIGKTYLIRKTLGSKMLFSHSGVENVGMEGQLRAFRSSLRDAGVEPNFKIKNWFDAFDALKDAIRKSDAPKKILFLDELPWMDTPKSNFVAALEFFWNSWASARDDVMLVVCGSATSWIINHILKARGGLHNRVSEQIRLQPFSLLECERYTSELGLEMSRQDIAEAFMALGGVAWYWSLLRPGASLAMNIDELFFAPDAKLGLEFSRLYSSLFKNPEPYMRVVEALGARGKGLERAELEKACGFSESGKLSKIVDELEQCGFVRRYVPFGARKKGSLVQLLDAFTLFHFRFAKENAKGDPTFWSSSFGNPAHNAWAGLAFERLCLLHIAQIRRALGISGVASGISSWRFAGTKGHSGAQIDLVIDRDDRIVNLCEMKYSSGPYEVDAEEANRLRERRETFIRETGTRKAVHMTLVSPYGLKQGRHSGVFQSIVTLDDLFQ